MSRIPGLVVAAVVGLASQPSPVRAQEAPRPAVVRTAFHAPGSIQGSVSDEGGNPLAGVMVSVLGRTAAFAITDAQGQCSIEPLPPGAYVIRAHLAGFVATRRDIVDVRPNGRTAFTIALRRNEDGSRAQETENPIFVAGLTPPQLEATTGRATRILEEDTVSEGHDHSGIAWRLRHLRRNVLKETDAEAFSAINVEEMEPSDGSIFSRALGTSARFATSLVTDLPISGEFNWLATGAFDSPRELFTASALPRSVAQFSVRAPGGPSAEWSIDGALTQGDVSSWIVAGDYTARPGATHLYRLGLAYSAQRYQGGNKAALEALGEGSRWAGSVFGFDSWALGKSLSVEYGARFARYGYLEGKGLFSPRLAVSMTPASLFNATLTISRRLVAPGAEEFVPQGINGLWLPPERTFAPIPGAALMPERIDHYDVAMDRSLFGMVVIGFQAFYQRVDHQTATLFDVRVPQEPVTHLGHYYVASAGDVKTRGWRVSLTRSFAPRLRGSVNYSRSSAEWDATTRSAALVVLAPSAARLAGESFHDITSSIESEIPVTATRIVALYKLNTAFANTNATDEDGSQKGFGTRFDVQVNQSLPFLDFTNAQWEILVAVRTLFREADPERSVFDELLVVRPPKRIVSGLLVKF